MVSWPGVVRQPVLSGQNVAHPPVHKRSHSFSSTLLSMPDSSQLIFGLGAALVSSLAWVITRRILSAITNGHIVKALWAAQKAWHSFDASAKRGKPEGLDLSETVSLLNSRDIQDAAFTFTNVRPTSWTERDLQPMFEMADAYKAGRLNRIEFLALYLGLAARRVAKEPLVLAQALLGFIDVDRNGRIEGKELKALLSVLGFPAAWLIPIPSHMGVSYRHVLNDLSHKKYDESEEGYAGKKKQKGFSWLGGHKESPHAHYPAGSKYA